MALQVRGDRALDEHIRATAAQRRQGLTRRLTRFRLSDPEPPLYHTEPIWRAGRMVGYLASGNYGHHLGGAIGLGYVPCDPAETAADLLADAYEIESPARVSPPKPASNRSTTRRARG